MDIVSAIGETFKAIGIALGWIKREEEKSDDFKIAEGADLKATVKEQHDAVQIDEAVDRLSDDELDRRLRESQTGGQ